MRPLLQLFRRDVHDLEFDPVVQYRFHKIWAWFWFLLMIIAPFVPRLRNDLATLAILEVSLWANFATHFGGMSAALAAISGQEQPSRQYLEEKIEKIPTATDSDLLE